MNPLPIIYVQPLDADGNPKGPVKWICESAFCAGSIYFDRPVTEDDVAAVIRTSSYRLPFPAAWDDIRATQELAVAFDLDPVRNAVAAPQL